MTRFITWLRGFNWYAVGSLALFILALGVALVSVYAIQFAALAIVLAIGSVLSGLLSRL